MSIRRQSKTSWEVRVYVPNPVTGKSERRSFTVKGSYQDARREEARLKAEAAAGSLATPTKDRLDEYGDRWLTSIKPTVRDNTWHAYKQVLSNWVYPYIGHMTINTITGETLNHLYGQLLQGGSSKGDGLSATSVKHTHALLKTMFADAVRWGHLVKNPADTANPPRVSGGGKDVWSVDELATFLEDKDPNPMWQALWRLAALTGMRRSELAGLRWSDINWSESKVTVNQVRVRAGNQDLITEPKTKTSRRSIPIDQETLATLKAWKRYLEFSRGAVDPTWRVHSSELVFTNIEGDPISLFQISHKFKCKVEELGLPRLSFHGLRHTHATLLIESGIPMKVVSDRLGHSNVAITLSIYTHPSDEMGVTAAETLAKKLA